MKRTGAEVVADALKALGVRHAFCIVSIHNMPLLDAINRLGFTKLVARATSRPACMRPMGTHARPARSA
jgi:thiamine pyrophosphate-dependent acetolactate synthase large subunit-like protein